MSEGHERLAQLIRDTEAECGAIARANAPNAFAEQAMAGVRAFYPLLSDLRDRANVPYANRSTGWGSPSFLQELLLGATVLIDLYDCRDMKAFRRTYGMSPEEMAGEVRDDRVIPIINTNAPLEWTPESVALLLPVLKTERVQLAHWRTEAFQNWFSGGKVTDIKQRGEHVFDQYFGCSPAERDRLYRRLRIHKYANPEKAYRSVVVGRWRNIVSIRPQIESRMLAVLEDLRDRPAIVKAEVLNGVKNLVSSPISAARGGIWRASHQQILEIARLSEHRRLSEALEDFVTSDISRGFWTPPVLDWLERTSAIPLPAQLTFDRYQRLIQHRHWEKFRNDVHRLFALLAAKNVDLGAISSLMDEWKTETLTAYQRAISSYGRTENWWAVLLGIVMPLPGGDSVASKVLYKLDEFLGVRGPLASPGRMLAQLVWRARRAGWPGTPLD